LLFYDEKNVFKFIIFVLSDCNDRQRFSWLTDFLSNHLVGKYSDMNFPNEIVIIIFSFLDPVFCITNLRLVAKEFNEPFGSENCANFLWATLYKNLVKLERKLPSIEDLKSWKDYFNIFKHIIEGKYFCKNCNQGTIEERRKRKLIKICKCKDFIHLKCQSGLVAKQFKCPICKYRFEYELISKDQSPSISPWNEYYIKIFSGLLLIFSIIAVIYYLLLLIHQKSAAVLQVFHSILEGISLIVLILCFLFVIFGNGNGLINCRALDSGVLVFLFYLGIVFFILFVIFVMANYVGNSYEKKMKRFYKIKEIS
jgi:hypothetical protein